MKPMHVELVGDNSAIYRGDDYEQRLIFGNRTTAADPDGEAFTDVDGNTGNTVYIVRYDLTGYTDPLAQIRERVNAPGDPAATLTVAIPTQTGDDKGAVDFSLSRAVTGGTTLAGKAVYFFDFQLTNPSGKVHTWAEGPIEVAGQISVESS